MLVTDHSPRPVVSPESMRFSFPPLRDSRVPGFQGDAVEQVPFNRSSKVGYAQNRKGYMYARVSLSGSYQI
jgi:hypothetical protein